MVLCYALLYEPTSRRLMTTMNRGVQASNEYHLFIIALIYLMLFESGVSILTLRTYACRRRHIYNVKCYLRLAS